MDPDAPDRLRPGQRARQAPCQAGCLTGADVRGWIATIAQRERTGLTTEQACERAWRTIVDVNPFPAVLGRICPHPCEAGCNRGDKDGAVSVNRLERYLGDWGIARGLALDRLDPGPQPESVGVVGSGPAGLSFAYQMARRGYPVTVYERGRHPGGMLRDGVPPYRLPRRVLDAEIGRILDLGIDLQLQTPIGRELSVEDLESRHDVLFLGIGAQRGMPLGIPGEDGPRAWLATDYLRRANAGETIDLGGRVAVVGGGNTAIDAARTARRSGAHVRLLYRRSREEMPARPEEVQEALDEGVFLEELTGVVRVERTNGELRGIVVQQMQLGEADASGRRRPLPVPGATRSVAVDALIAAVSQRPDWDGVPGWRPTGDWIRPAADGRLGAGVWVAGDVTGPGPAGSAIGHARRAAEALHARLRGLPARQAAPAAPPARVKPEYYPRSPRTPASELPADRRLQQGRAEVHGGLGERAFLDEVMRCLSCGECFGCESCWMFCAHGCFTRLEQPRPGSYFALATDSCQSCGKCVDLCPCGFLEIR